MAHGHTVKCTSSGLGLAEVVPLVEQMGRRLMAGPFVAMIGCGVTIWLAVSHPDPVIHDNVVRRGLVVEKPVSVPAHAAHGEVQ
jgi:hypothetical protein